MNIPMGPVYGVDYHGQEELVLSCIGGALNRTGRGQGFISIRRLGGTSLLLHLQFLVDPSQMDTPDWRTCWGALLQRRPLEIGRRPFSTVDALAAHLRTSLPVMPVYLPLSTARDDASLARALRQELALGIDIARSNPFVYRHFACLEPILELQHTSAPDLLESVLRALEVAHRCSETAPILWLLLDEARTLISDALEDEQGAWILPVLGQLRDALDFQSMPRRRSCFTLSLSLPPAVIDRATQQGKQKRPNYASSLLTRLDWPFLPLWTERTFRRFLQTHSEALLADSGAIWRAFRGLPVAAKRLIRAEQEHGPLDLAEEIELIRHSFETRQMVKHWYEDLGVERSDALVARNPGDKPAHAADLEELGLLDRDGRGGYQPPPTIVATVCHAQPPLDDLRLSFVLPGPQGLDPGARQTLGLGPNQVGAITLLPEPSMQGDSTPAQLRRAGVSGREFLALYSMAAAGCLAPPGVSADDLAELTRYLSRELPWLAAIRRTMEDEDPATPLSKVISGALQKLDLAAEFFRRPGRGRNTPYGLVGSCAVNLVPYVVTRGPGGARLVSVSEAEQRHLWETLRARFPNMPMNASDAVVDPVFAVEALLSRLFSHEELVQVLSSIPGCAGLIADLPGPGTSLNGLAHATVALLQRHGRINNELFNTILRSRPRRSADIRAVQARWTSEPPSSAPTSSSAPPTRSR